MRLTPQGKHKFAVFTRSHRGERLAIVHAGQLLSAPRIHEEITGGQLEIAGNFSLEEANRLATGLHSGARPSWRTGWIALAPWAGAGLFAALCLLTWIIWFRAIEQTRQARPPPLPASTPSSQTPEAASADPHE